MYHLCLNHTPSPCRRARGAGGRALSLWCVLPIMITLSDGCTPHVPEEAPPPLPAPETAPEQAARQYLALAQWAAGRPAEAARYRLLAAERLAAAGQLQRALETLPPEAPGLAARRALLQAELRLRLGQPARALHSLAGQPPGDGGSRRRWLELRLDAREALGDPTGAAEELAGLARFALKEEALETAERRLWQMLAGADEATLVGIETGVGDRYSGWVELALLDRRLQDDHRRWRQMLVYWNREFPAHPARRHILPYLEQRNRQLYPKPEQVAVLLPTSGAFRQAARAIREGILYAWHRSAARPVLRFYDTGQKQPAALLEQVVADGAEFVIGPLRKERLQALRNAATRPPISILALNRVQDDDPPADRGAAQEPPPYFVQYGLAPEDEARQVAEQAWLDGRRTALAILPGDEWGERIHHTFRERWEGLGGHFLELATFDQDADASYVDPVLPLLNIDTSRQRHRQLEAVLGNPLQGDPRPRRDADFLFLAAPPLVATQVVRQLRFYNIGELPIYATSRVHDTLQGLEAGNALDGIRFIDMPLRLQGEPWAGLEERMAAGGQDTAPNYERLFAFGADAYALITRIGSLARSGSSHYPGMSGNLQLTAEHTIRRRLSWAVYTNGIPVPE